MLGLGRPVGGHEHLEGTGSGHAVGDEHRRHGVVEDVEAGAAQQSPAHVWRPAPTAVRSCPPAGTRSTIAGPAAPSAVARAARKPAASRRAAASDAAAAAAPGAPREPLRGSARSRPRAVPRPTPRAPRARPRPGCRERRSGPRHASPRPNRRSPAAPSWLWPPSVGGNEVQLGPPAGRKEGPKGPGLAGRSVLPGPGPAPDHGGAVADRTRVTDRRER
jgi:hypothetical protein